MRFAIIPMCLLLLASCVNIPSDPAQITPAYTSQLKYEPYECGRLAIELNSLGRREAQLVAAQGQRRSSGWLQAFLVGFGTGDGVEASELAVVRGELDAVRKAVDIKNCDIARTNQTEQ